MTITVNTPDGGTAQFPDDTPKDTITSAMRAKFGGPDNSSSGGALNTAANVAKSFSDTATFGTGDYLRSLMTGEDLSKLQTSSKKAHEDLGWGDVPVTIAGYAANPFGMAGVGERIGAGLLTRMGTGAAESGIKKAIAYGGGAAAEGAAAQTLGDIGHGETPGGDVLTAGVLSAPFGAVVGGRARALGPALERATSKMKAPTGDTGVLGPVAKDFLGPEVPPPRALGESVLKANMDDAYTKLGSAAVKPPTVGNALQRTLSSLTPGERAGISDTLQGRIDKISGIIDNSPRLTLSDLHAFGSEISTGMRSPVDSKVGAKIAETFNRLDPRGLMEDARMKYGQFQDAQMLNKGLDASKWYKGANVSDTIAEAAKRVDPEERTKFSPAGREAMEALGNAGPATFGKMLDYAIAHGANKGIGIAAGTLGGGVIGHAALGALAGASGLGAGTGGIGGYIARMRTNAAARRAMKAALAATSTGQRATADMFRGAPWASQAARQAIYARGASGEGGD